ncbi:DMT family transporter [Paenibacillus radicis (ex Gao et al. 2016)]|uniref:Membrane protein n=1 Tax=Paenibacillus radicis (ex Gao et al. 2016) TaxID=1737354 RepID=A0A917HM73_9BACL|nr:DMT family transporter [Paenibacillus radicis (ex Gao et al. 2016)]GGG83062.1 membrane protein [Paenibacillus radicis (ex Gao et al. 2016)]
MIKLDRVMLGLCGVAIFWGFSYVISGYLLQSFSPVFLSFCRMIITSLFTLTLLFGNGGLRWPTRKEWLLLLASSLFGLFIQQPLYYLGLQLSSVANASLIYAAAPLVAVLLERVFFAVRMTGEKIAGGVLGLAGVVVIIGLHGASFQVSLGDLFLLLAMLGMTVGMLFTPVLARTMSNQAINLYACPIGIMLMAPLAAGEAALGRTYMTFNWGTAGLFLLLGAITMYSGLLWTKGVASTGPGTAAMFMNIPPIISLVAGHFILGEPIRGVQLAGGVLVLAGVYVSSRSMLRRQSLEQGTVLAEEN